MEEGRWTLQENQPLSTFWNLGYYSTSSTSAVRHTVLEWLKDAPVCCALRVSRVKSDACRSACEGAMRAREPGLSRKQRGKRSESAGSVRRPRISRAERYDSRCSDTREVFTPQL
jgi:hypothetical protein